MVCRLNKMWYGRLRSPKILPYNFIRRNATKLFWCMSHTPYYPGKDVQLASSHLRLCPLPPMLLTGGRSTCAWQSQDYPCISYQAFSIKAHHRIVVTAPAKETLSWCPCLLKQNKCSLLIQIQLDPIIPSCHREIVAACDFRVLGRNLLDCP